MQTSYFTKHKYINFENPVSIAGKSPANFVGRQFKKLAPNFWFFNKYKMDGDIEFYIEQYNKEVLSVLDPKKVYSELGENATLLCWEGSDKFCHRHLVAKWLMDNLNVCIKEYVSDI